MFLKDEGRIEALFTLYAIALLVQALIERELRRAMARQGINELPVYPEQRQCAHPTTEQVLRLFSLAQRHHLLQHGQTVQVFDLKAHGVAAPGACPPRCTSQRVLDPPRSDTVSTEIARKCVR